MTRRDSLRVGTTDLEMRWIGPGPTEAPTIIMLHDGGSVLSDWGAFPDHVSATTRCGVFLYARAGHGYSDPLSTPPSNRFLYDEALQALPEILDAIGFERGLLLGHGEGASIATIYAGGVADYRVRGLILLNPCFVAAPGGLDLRDQLGHIRVPIQLLHGEGMTVQAEAAREETYCPIEVAVLAGAQDAPHRDDPAEAVRVVASFAETLLDLAGERSVFPLRGGS